jgi:hypothetical protein
MSDKGAWGVMAGTPKGRNQFWDIYETARRIPDEWFVLRLPASESGLLPQSELNAAKAQLSEDQYLQEYECSFEAAILGAFFGTEMRQAEPRINERVVFEPGYPVHTAWDLGYRDDTAIWWYQVVGGEVRVIDFYAVSGADIRAIAEVVVNKGYTYGKHHLPHDARAKTLAAAGKSIIEQLAAHLGFANLAVVPELSVQDGIQAVRKTLPHCYFNTDNEDVRTGLSDLRTYQRQWDDKRQMFKEQPLHDWSSNPADAFRMFALAMNPSSARKGAQVINHTSLPTNVVTLERLFAEREARQAGPKRI